MHLSDDISHDEAVEGEILGLRLESGLVGGKLGGVSHDGFDLSGSLREGGLSSELSGVERVDATVGPDEVLAELDVEDLVVRFAEFA